MKKFLTFSLVLGFLFSVSALVQAAEVNQPAVNAPRYGLQLKPFVLGVDFRDNYPHSSSTLEILSGWAWADQVGGWFQFNPAIALPFLPPQNLRIASAATSSITLHWQNIKNQQTDDLQLFQGDANNNFEDRPKRDNLQNQESFTVDGLTANTLYGFYLEAQKRVEGQHAPQSVYTPTVQGRTTRDEGQPGAGEFGLTCSPIDKNTISLIWAGPTLNEGQSLALYYSSSEENFEQNVKLLAEKLNNTGSFSHDNLEPDTTVYYRLKLTDKGGAISWIPSIANPVEPAVSCATLGEISQDPSNLAITTLSRSSLYITWRDNAVRPHNFQIERIKITPASSIITSVEPLDMNQLKIKWTNKTNADPFKSPYYHVVERAENPNFDNAVSAQVSFVDDQDYVGRQTDYERTDENLTEATVYYYRLKACSFIRVVLDGRNQEICSPVSAVVSNATPLAAPTNLTAQAIKVDVLGTNNNVVLHWQDNSQAEDGYEWSWVKDNFIANLPQALDANTTSFTDKNVASGNYVYSVRAFKLVGQKKVYSAAAQAKITVTAQGGEEEQLQGQLNSPSFLANIWSSVKNLLSRFNPRDFLISLSSRISQKAVAEDKYDLEKYFQQSRRQLDIDNYPSVFRDDGLESDTVYLYRVKGIYTDNGQPAETRYTVAMAGKTFTVGRGLPAKVKVCVRNNLCSEVQGEIVDNQRPIDQCVVNADCANVGTYRRVIKETKGR